MITRGDEPPLYHWSPQDRRESIMRRGLVPRQLPAASEVNDIDPAWRAPYICLAEDPLWAWLLSGNVHRSPVVWDLWHVLLEEGHLVHRIRHDARDREALSGHEHIRWREWRVHDRISPRGVHWIGSRPGAAFSLHRRPTPHWPLSKPYSRRRH